MATATADKTASVLDRPIAALFQFTWEKIAYAGLIVAAFITRFYDLGARVMSHDESLHTQWSWYLFQGRGFQHTPLMHGPLKFEVTAFLYWLLGDNDFTSRIPAALAGVAAVWLCYFFRKWLGRAGALSAAVLMLISPYQLYYSRYIRDEPLVMVWGLLLALLVFNYVEKRDNRLLYWLSALMALFYATMETSFIYIALAMLFLGVYFLWELTVTAWPGGSDQARSGFWISLGVAALAAVVGVAIFFYLDRLGLSGTAFTPSSADPDSPAANPGAAAGTAMSLLFLAAALAGGVAVFFFVRAFRGGVRDFPAFNLLVVMLAFALPQLTAFPVRALHRDPQAYTLPPVTGTDLFGNLAAILSSDAGVTLMVMLALLGASLAGGIFWNSRVFLICAGIFYGLYIPLFTTFFTNGGGIMTGIVGSLGYWLDQHAVRRASQPWYYYLLINLPVYEFLPVLAALMAAGLGLRRLWRGSQPTLEGAAPAAGRRDFPGLLFIAWWSVMALPAFSIAGEKMPWLTTHIVLPLILIGGWAIGWFIERIDWQHFAARRAWLVAAILPLTLLALTALFGTLLGTNRPFQGTELNQLQDTGVFVSALIVSGIGLYALYQLGAPLGWGNVARLAVLAFFGLLALVTARTAFVATYINYDAANEYLVYAHGARGVKTVMEQIDDISERTTDGLGLRVAYDDDVSWPMTWYLRDYDNAVYYAKQPTRDALNSPVVLAASTKWSQVESLLGDRYYQYEYIRMVWPMQDYFYMTAKSVRHGLILAPSQCHSADDLTITAGCENLAGGLWSNARYRQALWNIWFSRDYSLYGELTNGNFELSQWPVNDRMRMYVRKDIAAQIWPFGTTLAAYALLRFVVQFQVISIYYYI